jgi:hypothetical protein
MSWSRRFDEPIKLPDGRQLATLRHAGDYITKLPKAVHEAKEWQTATDALILLIVKHNGPTIMARVGMMWALNRNVERVCLTPRARIRIGDAASSRGANEKVPIYVNRSRRRRPTQSVRERRCR